MELFKLFGKIAIENNEANSSIDETTGKAEKSESRMSSAFKKIGTAVVAGFATDKIIEFGKSIVDASASVAAEQSAFEQIMGEYSDTAQQKVNEIADTTGMVSTRLTPYMTSMTAKFKGLGYDIDDATTLAQNGLNLAADASAFWDKSLEDSMGALNSFINGSYEGGEAIGLFANDTQLASYAVKNSIVSEAKEWSNLDEAKKQATRLQYAQDMMQASGATGQAAKEAGEYANVQANLNEKWRQFKSQIGEPLLQNIVIPAMDKLGGLVDKLSQAYQNLQPKLQNFKEKMHVAGDYAEQKFKPAIDSLKNGTQKLKDVFQPLIDKIKDFFDNISQSDVMEGFKTAVDGVSGFVSDFGDHLGKAADNLKAMKKWAQENKTVLELLGGAIAILTAAIVGYNIQQAIKNAGGIVEIAQLALTAAGVAGLTIAEGLHTAASTVAAAATTAFGVAMSFLTSPVTLVILAIGALIAIVVLLVKNWDTIKEKAQEIWQKVVEFFTNLKEDIKNVFTKIKEKISEIWNNIKASFLKIVVNIVLWVKNKWQELKDKTSEIFNKVKETVTNIWNSIKTKISDFVNKIKTTVTNIWDNIKEKTSNVFNSVKETATNVWNKIKSAIEDPINKAKDAVKKGIDKMKSFFDFKWELPKLKMPHFKASGKFSLDPLSVPKFNIEWYAKGGILDEPTMFGFNNSTGSAMVGGEAGPEAVTPIAVLLDYVKTAVREENSNVAYQIEKLIALLDAYLPKILANMVKSIILDSGVLVGELGGEFDRKLGDISKMKERGM